MALNPWQKITRVLPGMPFGDGKDGAYSSATIPTMVSLSMDTKASGNTAITVSASSLANGDVVLIHQSRGTGAGQWEINRVASGGGTTSIVLQAALHYSYTDSGASQVQIVKIPRYTNVTQSGTWTRVAWNGNTGGIVTFAAKGEVSFASTFQIHGTNSGNSVPPDTNKGNGGFIGGAPRRDNFGMQGEGTGGAGTTTSASNGNGGGGSSTNSTEGAGGGSGGNASAGQSGSVGAGGTPGSGGGSSGNFELTLATFGGSGGGSGINSQTVQQGNGGTGGGLGMVFAKKVLNITGSITLNGGNGGPGDQGRWGGSGAGGSFLLACQDATLGSSKITATGGSMGGSTGSVGRIAVHRSGTVTGSTNPTATFVFDGTLVETNAGILSFM